MVLSLLKRAFVLAASRSASLFLVSSRFRFTSPKLHSVVSSSQFASSVSRSLRPCCVVENQNTGCLGAVDTKTWSFVKSSSFFADT